MSPEIFELTDVNISLLKSVNFIVSVENETKKSRLTTNGNLWPNEKKFKYNSRTQHIGISNLILNTIVSGKNY